MPPAPVLIVGAGPSGLNLALALVRRNVQCRLISEGGGPGEESRAMVVQARTLEFYGQYGFAGEVIEQGVVAETALYASVVPVEVEKFSPSVSKKWARASARIHSHSLIRRTITNGS
jgi:2-polyprenyl-6-methoxyphenol hydroxylase-like FAD-dependent oxidoreductase